MNFFDVRTCVYIFDKIADFVESKNIRDKILRIESFTQTWGSTALGFDCIGGDCISDALTTLLYASENNETVVYVFFDSRFAYTAYLDDVLRECISEKSLPSCRKAKETLKLI